MKKIVNVHKIRLLTRVIWTLQKDTHKPRRGAADKNHFIGQRIMGGGRGNRGSVVKWSKIPTSFGRKLD